MTFQTMYYAKNGEDLMTGKRIIASSWEEAESLCQKGFVSGELISEEDFDGNNKIEYS